MPFLTQTYTRDATTCPRPKGSEAATAGRAATASGGRDSMIFPPRPSENPHFSNESV